MIRKTSTKKLRANSSAVRTRASTKKKLEVPPPLPLRKIHARSSIKEEPSPPMKVEPSSSFSGESPPPLETFPWSEYQEPSSATSSRESKPMPPAPHPTPVTSRESSPEPTPEPAQQPRCRRPREPEPELTIKQHNTIYELRNRTIKIPEHLRRYKVTIRMKGIAPSCRRVERIHDSGVGF